MAEGFDPEHSSLVRDVGNVLRVVKALQVVPAPLMWLAGAVIAALYYFLSRIDLLDLLRRWNEAATPEPVPTSLPIPMPEGGIPVPGEPHTGEQP